MANNSDFGLDVGTYGPLATPETIVGLAQLAESLDFSAVWLADHVVFPTRFASKYPYSPTGAFPTALDLPLLEPIAVMGVLAGATKRVRLGTAVLVMPYRNPVVLSRMLITIDQFSGGRVILGAGVGWLEEEFEVLDSPAFAKRGKATDEYLEIFKALCAGGPVGYQGETYRFADVHSSPGAVQQPHPPIVIGGVSNPALRRTARLGDGWLAVAIGPHRIRECLGKLKGYCEAEGRTLDDLSLTYKIFLSIGEAKQGRYDEREPGTGSPAQIIDDLKAIRDMGFGHIVFRYRGEGADAQMAQITRFAEDIIPKV